MRELLPIASLTQTARNQQGFELVIPNPIMGKAIFLRLPMSGGWTYDLERAESHSERTLILRDQMWVTRGEAQFLGIHESGRRVEFTIKINSWKPRAASVSDKADWTNLRQQPDERAPLKPTFGWLQWFLRDTSEQRLRIRCHHTERQIDFGLQSKDAALPRDVLDSFIAAIQCH
jgi:hypothetical protein